MLAPLRLPPSLASRQSGLAACAQASDRVAGLLLEPLYGSLARFDGRRWIPFVVAWNLASAALGEFASWRATTGPRSPQKRVSVTPAETISGAF